MDIKRVTLTERPYLFIEREVPMAEIGPAMGQMIGQLFSFLGQNGIAPNGMPMAIYPEMPSKTVKFRMAVFVTADDAAKASGEVEADTFPAVDALTATHTGPYDKLGQSHQALWKAMGEQGLNGGMMWEVYIDDPQATAPDKLRTEIYRAII